MSKILTPEEASALFNSLWAKYGLEMESIQKDIAQDMMIYGHITDRTNDRRRTLIQTIQDEAKTIDPDANIPPIEVMDAETNVVPFSKKKDN